MRWVTACRDFIGVRSLSRRSLGREIDLFARDFYNEKLGAAHPEIRVVPMPRKCWFHHRRSFLSHILPVQGKWRCSSGG